MIIIRSGFQKGFAVDLCLEIKNIFTFEVNMIT